MLLVPVLKPVCIMRTIIVRPVKILVWVWVLQIGHKGEIYEQKKTNERPNFSSQLDLQLVSYFFKNCYCCFTNNNTNVFIKGSKYNGETTMRQFHYS